MVYSGSVRDLSPWLLIEKRKRQSWDDYFMMIADIVSTRSTCLSRRTGAILVKDKHIISTGYNGAPRGIRNCVEKGYCNRKKMGFKSGEGLEYSYAVHAEENAILQAAYHGHSTKGAVMYATTSPCVFCAKSIINAGIVKVHYIEDYPHDFSLQLFKEAGIETVKYPKERLGQIRSEFDEILRQRENKNKKS
ncbi:cytidine deaminase [Candidatus Micrarchaeota archaeon]|nr:MAG: cytidine deaminase [Candidatus Micrarchaeota archaeon]